MFTKKVVIIVVSSVAILGSVGAVVLARHNSANRNNARATETIAKEKSKDDSKQIAEEKQTTPEPNTIQQKQTTTTAPSTPNAVEPAAPTTKVVFENSGTIPPDTARVKLDNFTPTNNWGYTATFNCPSPGFTVIPITYGGRGGPAGMQKSDQSSGTLSFPLDILPVEMSIQVGGSPGCTWHIIATQKT